MPGQHVEQRKGHTYDPLRSFAASAIMTRADNSKRQGATAMTTTTTTTSKPAATLLALVPTGAALLVLLTLISVAVEIAKGVAG